jgi:hypothetical protein
MTILIPLGTGSRWKNNELRYCLRGICKHLHNWTNIVLIGEKPDWLKPDQRLIHLPFPEKPSSRQKEQNIHKKIINGIESGHCSGDFLFMNDDHFILQDLNAKWFPCHHKGPLSETLKQTKSVNGYARTIKNTLAYLVGKGIQAPNNYDTHCPIIYNGEKYLQVMAGLSFPDYGYCLKTMYCNLTGAKGFYYPDLKVRSIDNGFPGQIQGRLYFSTGAVDSYFLLETEMNKLYPNPSIWENQ